MSCSRFFVLLFFSRRLSSRSCTIYVQFGGLDVAEAQELSNSRATSSAFRPACTCFIAPMIHA